MFNPISAIGGAFGGSSQTSIVKVFNEAINKSAVNYINSTKTTANATTLNTNTFTLDNRGTINCPIDFSQTIQSEQKVTVMGEITNLSDFKNDIKAIIATTVAQGNEAVNGWLSSATGSQNNSSDITNKLNNIIENNITNENLTTCNALIQNMNKGTFTNLGTINCPEGKDFKINQGIVAEQMAFCYTKAINSALIRSGIIAEATADSDQENKMENKGADDFAGTILEGVNKMLMTAGLIIVALIVGAIFLLPTILKFMNPASQEDNEQNGMQSPFVGPYGQQ
jgi:hypothetical protein